MPVEMIWIVGVIGVGFAILGFDLYAATAARCRKAWMSHPTESKQN